MLVGQKINDGTLHYARVQLTGEGQRTATFDFGIFYTPDRETFAQRTERLTPSLRQEISEIVEEAEEQTKERIDRGRRFGMVYGIELGVMNAKTSPYADKFRVGRTGPKTWLTFPNIESAYDAVWASVLDNAEIAGLANNCQAVSMVYQNWLDRTLSWTFTDVEDEEEHVEEEIIEEPDEPFSHHEFIGFMHKQIIHPLQDMRWQSSRGCEKSKKDYESMARILVHMGASYNTQSQANDILTIIHDYWLHDRGGWNKVISMYVEEMSLVSLAQYEQAGRVRKLRQETIQRQLFRPTMPGDDVRDPPTPEHLDRILRFRPAA